MGIVRQAPVGLCTQVIVIPTTVTDFRECGTADHLTVHQLLPTAIVARSDQTDADGKLTILVTVCSLAVASRLLRPRHPAIGIASPTFRPELVSRRAGFGDITTATIRLVSPALTAD